MTIVTDGDGNRVKWCEYHGRFHPVAEFYAMKGGDGLDYYCQTARRQLQRLRYHITKKRGGRQSDN